MNLFVISLTGVQKHVIFEIVLLWKSALTDRTLERPIAAVGVGMRFQIARRRKRLQTDETLVRLVLGVCHSMIVKVGRGRESFAANRTFVWLFTFSKEDPEEGGEREMWKWIRCFRTKAKKQVAMAYPNECVDACSTSCSCWILCRKCRKRAAFHLFEKQMNMKCDDDFGRDSPPENVVPVWVRMCRRNRDGRSNALPQTSQGNRLRFGCSALRSRCRTKEATDACFDLADFEMAADDADDDEVHEGLGKWNSERNECGNVVVRSLLSSFLSSAKQSMSAVLINASSKSWFVPLDLVASDSLSSLSDRSAGHGEWLHWANSLHDKSMGDSSMGDSSIGDSSIGDESNDISIVSASVFGGFVSNTLNCAEGSDRGRRRLGGWRS